MHDGIRDEIYRHLKWGWSNSDGSGPRRDEEGPGDMQRVLLHNLMHASGGICNLIDRALIRISAMRRADLLTYHQAKPSTVQGLLYVTRSVGQRTSREDVLDRSLEVEIVTA